MTTLSTDVALQLQTSCVTAVILISHSIPKLKQRKSAISCELSYCCNQILWTITVQWIHGNTVWLNLLSVLKKYKTFHSSIWNKKHEKDTEQQMPK